jgi:hypothetical protein
MFSFLGPKEVFIEHVPGNLSDMNRYYRNRSPTIARARRASKAKMYTLGSQSNVYSASTLSKIPIWKFLLRSSLLDIPILAAVLLWILSLRDRISQGKSTRVMVGPCINRHKFKEIAKYLITLKRLKSPDVTPGLDYLKMCLIGVFKIKEEYQGQGKDSVYTPDLPLPTQYYWDKLYDRGGNALWPKSVGEQIDCLTMISSENSSEYSCRASDVITSQSSCPYTTLTQSEVLWD